MRAPSAASIAIVLFLLSLPTAATDATQEWIERRLEFRYVLFIEELWSMRIGIEQSRIFNEKQRSRGKQDVYLGARAMFEPTTIISVPGAKDIGVVLLAFDAKGRITNQRGALGTMSAKLSRIYDLQLAHLGETNPNSYYLAEWSQGIPGDVTFSPAVCSSDDKRRYQPNWNAGNFLGNFGCREWTAQLYDRQQLYIDVTSYRENETFIGEVIGWSRFEDPPKPVIGRHGKTWLCLHDCPAGEKPGVIQDIRKWTARHGFPMPERPSKQPLYPDSDYQDDLNEFWQQD